MQREVFTVATERRSADLAARHDAPLADHHQHLFSPAIVSLLGPGSGITHPIAAADVIALLDTAGIRRALVLSVAYMYGSPARAVDDEYAAVRAENDWTADQVAHYPERLRAFFALNPLKDYALDEIARCARHPQLRHGIKFHFGNSDVQLDAPAHVEQLARVFQAVNREGMAIVVHLRASISRQRPYGAAQARVFLEELLPLVPDIHVQVAHLAGSGPGYEDPAAESAMAVLAAAVEQGDPRTRQLWFDVATVAQPPIAPDTAGQLARRIRQVGVDRVLYGSDAAAGDNLRPRESWEAFRRLPLLEEELGQIARNVAPYLP